MPDPSNDSAKKTQRQKRQRLLRVLDLPLVLIIREQPDRPVHARGRIDMDEPAVGEVLGRGLGVEVAAAAGDALVLAAAVIDVDAGPGRAAAGVGGLDPGGLAAERDHAQRGPARAPLDLAHALHQPRALRRLAELHAREEQRHADLAQAGADAGVERLALGRQRDARRDLPDEVGVGRGLRRRHARRDHRRRRHVRVCPQQDNVAHVVQRPDVRRVVAAVLQYAAEGWFCLRRVPVLRWQRLERRPQVLREEVQRCADALPFFERGCRCRGEVDLRFHGLG